MWTLESQIKNLKMFCIGTIFTSDEQLYFHFGSSQFMAVTHSGPTGLSAAEHVDRELNVALAHAPIPHQQMVDETAVD